MGQPVRKNIKEAHSDLISEPPITTLLIDGNSLLFMCFRDDKVTQDGTHYGAVYQFLLQVRKMMEHKNFDYVYAFFDSTYSGWLRWNLYNEYKANRDKKYDEYGLSDYMRGLLADERNMLAYFKRKQARKAKKEADAAVPENEKSKSQKYKEFIDSNFDRERDILCSMFNDLYIRWNIDEVTEGDDQIAYYCLHKKPNERIVIMSGDMDLTQLLADDIIIYNLGIKDFVTIKNFKEKFGYYYENTLVKKIFSGDVSDNIGNIKGLTEEGFFNLMPEAYERKVTVEEVKEKAQKLINERKENKKKPLQVHENIINGVSNKEYNGDFYEINKKIIDLKHPLLSDEAVETMENMMYAPMSPEGRSYQNLYKKIIHFGIQELIGDTKFAEFFSLYKRLEKKELNRLEENQKK